MDPVRGQNCKEKKIKKQKKIRGRKEEEKKKEI